MRLIAWLVCFAGAALFVAAVQRAGTSHLATPGAGPWRRAVEQFAVDRGAMIALYVLAVLALVAIMAPLLASQDPTSQPDIVGQRLLAPSLGHLFGTDFASRDVFSRVLYGSRITLVVAALASFVTVAAGTAWGAIAGFYGGRIDGAMMRIIDALLSVPRILILIAVVAIAGGGVSLPSLILLIGITGWFSTSRLVRAQVLTLREQDLTVAARALGARDWEILWRHLLPNVATTVIVAATLALGHVVYLEAALSYLGIGVQPPTPSWGVIIHDGSEQIVTHWWLSVFPGLAIVITCLAANVLGDGLRDAFDPRQVDVR